MSRLLKSLSEAHQERKGEADNTPGLPKITPCARYQTHMLPAYKGLPSEPLTWMVRFPVRLSCEIVAMPTSSPSAAWGGA